MKLISINTGLPRTVTWQGKSVTTGIFKEPVGGPQAQIRGKTRKQNGQNAQVLVGKTREGAKLHQGVERGWGESVHVRLMDEIRERPGGYPDRKDLVIPEALAGPGRERGGRESQGREPEDRARAQGREAVISRTLAPRVCASPEGDGDDGCRDSRLLR